MLKSVNRGAGDTYFNLENEWRSLLKQEPSTKIEVDISPRYSAGSKVPDIIVVEYSVNDGKVIYEEFLNVK